MNPLILYINALSEIALQELRQSLLEQIAYRNHDYSSPEQIYDDVARIHYLRGQLDLVDSILTNLLPIT